MDEFVRSGKRNPFSVGKLDNLLNQPATQRRGVQTRTRIAVRDDSDKLVAETFKHTSERSERATTGTQSQSQPQSIPVFSEADSGQTPDTVPPEMSGLPGGAAPQMPDKKPEDKEGTIFVNGQSKQRVGKVRSHLGGMSKKKLAIIAVVVLLVLGGGAGAYLVFGQKKAVKTVAKTPTATTDQPVETKPTTEASALSGLQVDPSLNKRPVTAVMIENSPEARPQSGLLQASIVFEAVAEGGITRFNALFQDTSPDYIGPVRSVRPYYIDWFWPFDAAIAHAGGSTKGLADVKSLHIKDLDQFANSGSYERVSNRYAPHNLYTSLDKLLKLSTSKGFTSSTFKSFPRKAEKALATPTAKKIDLTISGYYFNVHYDYDAASNSYLRSEGGAAHKDEKTGKQLSPKVVVAVVMQRGLDGDGQHTDYTTTGSGKVFVYQDGGVTEGTWSKTSRQDQWKFVDNAGAPLPFNPGQTWISMVDTPGSVTAKP